MTPRGRKASGGMSAVASAPAASNPAAPGSERNDSENGSRHLRWEEWFQNASTIQRDAMLTLAARQGLLYAHQVPHPANGLRTKSAPEDAVRLQDLVRLLDGKTDALVPVVVRPLDFSDQQLDRLQREAVSRATFTPDVFLLQGLPGTGRSRVVAEILMQAALRGERVLFLANNPASLDAVLLRLVQSPAVLALRYLGPGELLSSLSPALRCSTLSERQRTFQEHALRNAAQRRAKAQQRLDRRHAETACWPLLRDLAKQLTEAQQQLDESAQGLSKVADDVTREAAAGAAHGPFGAEVAKFETKHREAVEALKTVLREDERKHATTARELEDVDREIQKLRPWAEAKQQGRWWTLGWWRATFRGQVTARISELDGRRHALATRLLELQQSQEETREKCRCLEEQHQADRARLLHAETERRRQEVRSQETERTHHLQQLTQQWHKILDVLENPDHRPGAPTQEAVAAALASWEGERGADEEAHQFSCRWEDYLAAAGDALRARIPGWANVLAGTMTALSRDLSFAEAASGCFDLLVLEEAEQFTETDVLQAARRAARWVLVAQTHGPVEASAGASPSGSRSAVGGPLLPQLGCFQKLWQSLHCDSSRLHYSWSRENARLCCTLRPVSVQERAHLEIERVADFPEIELRILAVPKAPPLLAQVTFPPAMTVAQAKAFIYRELEEVAVQSMGRGAWLVEEADRFHLHLSAVTPDNVDCLQLEEGLCERVVSATGRTCRLEFDRSACWTRSLVDQWLLRRLQLRDLGRTVALQVPYRMENGLAGPLSDILFAGDYLVAPDAHGVGRLEFVSVPPLRKDDKRKSAPGVNGFPALPHGAGLEQDLTVQRIADRLPSDLRAELPRRGFANFLEAQAVIRKLEELVARGQAAGEPVAVIALYEGQVELLRRLAARSEVLRAQARAVEFGLPILFQERERPTVLVSLTRSHDHRAVPFGDRESDLALALTRARQRLIVFGDAGALVKRSRWQGPLEHLDAGAAALEARRVTALLRWMSGAIPNSL
jgi:hypothetical protein